MGRLKSLEVENFKSYLGHHIIGPLSNFSCVVGPNGTGKSNFMDAISFVLGVQEKHLRSTSLADLINGGKGTKKPKSAYVKLVYEDFDDDSTSSEFIFCRKITASGNSSFSVNNTTVNHSQYMKSLESIGVLAKVRNFLIFQGDVEKMAQKSPMELTQLIEHLSGSESLREEYETLHQQKTQLEEQILNSMQKKKMMANQCKEVKEQKDEAAEYSVKQEELKELKLKLYLIKIYQLKQETQRKRGQVSKSGEKLLELDGDIKTLEEIIINMKKEVAKSNKQLSSMEKDLSSHNKQRNECKKRIQESDTTIQALMTRKVQLQKSYSKIEEDQRVHVSALALIEAEIDTLKTEEKTLKRELQSLSTSSTSGASSSSRTVQGGSKEWSDDVIEAYFKWKEDSVASTAKQTAAIDILKTEIKTKEIHLQTLLKDKSTNDNELKSKQTMLHELQARASRGQHTLIEKKKEVMELNSTKDKVLQDYEKKKDEISQLKDELVKVTTQINETQDTIRRNKQEIREIEAIESMKRLLPGVYGRLVELCQPVHPKYHEAITVSMGRHMNAIVVETKQVASECIDYLKEQRIGRCAFIPLDTIKTLPISDRLRNLGSKYKLCVDLLEYKDQYKKAILYAVGATMICDTLEEARDLCFNKNERVKVVTLQGHIISKTGAMTGGSTGNGTNERMDKWKENELIKLMSRKTELESSLSKYAPLEIQRDITVLDEKITYLQSTIEYQEAELSVLQERITQVQSSLSQYKADTQTKETTITTQEKDIVQLKKTLEETIAKKNDIEMSIMQTFSQDNSQLSNLINAKEKSISDHDKVFTRLKEINKRLMELNTHQNQENKRQFTHLIERLQSQLQTIDMELSTLHTQKETYQTEEEQLVRQVKQIEIEIKKNKTKETELSTKLKEKNREYQGLIKEKDSVNVQISSEEIEIEKLRSQQHELLQQSTIDEITLPFITKPRKRHTTITTTTTTKTQSSSTARSSSYTSSNEEEDDDDDDDDDFLMSYGGESSDLTHTATTTTTTPSAGMSGGMSKRTQRGQQRTQSDIAAMEEEDTTLHSSSHMSASLSTHFSQSQNPIVKRDSSVIRQIDVSTVQYLKNRSQKQIDVEISKLEEQIQSLQTLLTTIQPNMHSIERYETVLQKWHDTSDNLEELKTSAREINQAFDIIKIQRKQLFETCYKHISDAVGIIYKDLTISSKHPLGGNAYFTLDNTEEPYLSGIRFTAMPPMKRFRDMDQLSGGEKTIAALALLFSIYSYRQAPFFVLDEIDAALDNVNIKKVCNYIQKRSKDFQCIVITHKDLMYEKADTLIGVCKDHSTQSSRILTLDLTSYA